MDKLYLVKPSVEAPHTVVITDGEKALIVTAENPQWIRADETHSSWFQETEAIEVKWGQASEIVRGWGVPGAPDANGEIERLKVRLARIRMDNPAGAGNDGPGTTDKGTTDRP